MALKTLVYRLVQQTKVVNYAPIIIKYGSYQSNGEERISRKKCAGVLFASVLVGTAVKELTETVVAKEKDAEKKDGEVAAGARRPDLPTYSAEEVSKHDTTDNFWVTYKHGVYDVTSFLSSHPGGEQILNAAGLSIEPFWNVYGMHKTPEIFALLESFRIGNLRDEDVVDHTDDEMWVKEPVRDRRLIIKTAKPFNAEIPMKLQVEHFDTPNELFYVRQHMPVPEMSAGSHTLSLRLGGRGGGRLVALPLEQLARLPRAELRAALMCAGNRRSEMNEVKPVKGLSWKGGAISNAVWSGVYLRDVLVHCGLDMNDTHGKHIIFTGSDIDATGHNFSTSIPLSMAVDPSSRILLATHMNGVTLPPDHGYPLRVIVPGAPAVRSVKWLESITISNDESSSHWHKQDYRSFNPSKTWETADFATAPPVYSLPVTSAICDPADGEAVKLKGGYIEVRGYAYSGGGAKILRVDISTNRGETWEEAECMTSDDAPPYHYSWALWTAKLKADKGELELWVKATDSNFNTQPEKFDDIWNIRGILSNAYHKIKVQVV